jgi:hypothetical protein
VKESVSTKYVTILRSPTENEDADFVMPAWMAGIQIRKDASENVHVNLDSSTPCWKDATEEALIEVTEVLLPVFTKNPQSFRVTFSLSYYIVQTRFLTVPSTQ